MNIILRLTKMATRHKWNLILAYACMLGATTSFLITPKFIGKAVDKIAASYNDGIIPTSLIIETVIAIVLLMSIRGFLSFWQTSLGENLSHKIAYSLRNKFFNKVQTISFDFHDKWHTGELISRAISDIENVRMSINMGLMRAPYFIAMFVIVSILLINLHWMLGIISIAFMPIISFNSINVRLKMRQLLRKIQITTAELSTISQENFSGARVVRSFASSKYEQSKFDSKNQEIFYQTIDAEKLRAKNATFMRFAFTVSIGIVLLIGGRLVINNELTWGELTQFIIYMQILSMPVTMAAWLVNAYARAVSSGERLFEILDAKSKLKESTNALKIEKSNGSIGIITSFAAHATIYSDKQMQYSRDYPGAIVDSLEQLKHIDMAAFCAGAVGSHSPNIKGSNGSEKISKLSSELFSLAFENIENIELKNINSISSILFDIPLREPHMRITESLRLRPWVFNRLTEESKAYLSLLKIGDIILVGTPCDFSGELVSNIESNAKQNNHNIMVTSFNGGYIGYITNDKWYNLKKYETFTMNWFGPYNGSYFVYLINNLIELII